MAKITAEMKEIAANAEVFALATANKDDKPNVVSITFAKVLSDNELLLMDNFMQKTRQNIDANPIVAVSVWANSKGYQFKGKARVETSGKIFDEGTQWVKSASPTLNPKAAVIVKVDEIYIITGGPDAGKRVA